MNDSGDIFVLEINVFAAFNPGSVMSKLTGAAGISHQEFWGAIVKKTLGRVPNSKMKKGAYCRLKSKTNSAKFLFMYSMFT